MGFSGLIRFVNNPTVLVIAAIVMIFALVFHNVVQAFVAARFGDRNPRMMGYGSFDLQRHLDPIGVLFLLLLGFGWPRAVPVNSRNYRGRGRAEAYVWLAGIASYLLVGFVSMVVAAVFRATGSSQLYAAFTVGAVYAIIHAVVNLFPVLPLDMAHAVLAWGNRSLRQFVQQIAQFGVLGFMVFFLVLSFLGVIGWLQQAFLQLFDSIIRLIPGL